MAELRSASSVRSFSFSFSSVFFILVLLLFRNFFQFFRNEHPALVLLIETLHEFGVFGHEFHVGCIFRFHQEFINLLLSRFQLLYLRLTFLHGFLSLTDLLLLFLMFSVALLAG